MPGERLDTAPFGRTGHASSRVVFGGAALGSMGDEKAAEVLAVLDEFGVNHLDTAASYGDSELRLAPWLAGRRDDFFLATKTGDRTGPAARASLERSLERLGVDSVDLVQLHNLVEPDEWEIAHGPGGAVEALVAAKEEGLARHIGVTGHGLRIPGMHLRSLERYPFDSVLFPYSWVLTRDPDYARDAAELVESCAERGVAVQTIKYGARRRWADPDAPHFSWYEPISDAGALRRSVQWVLSHPGLFLNTSSDVTVLRPTLEAAVTAAGVPDAADLDADLGRAGIEPIFDGDSLERI